MSQANNTAAVKPIPSIYISHGGGPCFFMTVPKQHMMYKMSKGSEAQKFYSNLFKQLKLHNANTQSSASSTTATDDQKTQPVKAVLIVSAHWETGRDAPLRISHAEQHPELLYDYSFGPEYEAPHFMYPTRGAPELSRQVQELLSNAQIKSELDSTRKFDHGVFVPMKLMAPAGDMPIVELSINRNYSPEFHFAVGEALAPLRSQGVLIIGSGSTTHDLSFQSTEAQAKPFVAALHHALTEVSPEERKLKLTQWEQMPHARVLHPQEDHLTPLHVAVGAASQGKGERIFQLLVGGFAIDSWSFN